MPRLWKTPVEKPVEIVENSELSTGFLLFSFLLFLWKSLHISMHIPFSAQKRDVLRHRRKEAVTGKTSGKSCLPVKKCCRKPLALSLNCEKFVKNRQRMIWRFRGILERNGNGSSISQYHHTGGCHAGKVEICGVNTSRLHVLSQVEMDALLRRAQAGDEDARGKTH